MSIRGLARLGDKTEGTCDIHGDQSGEIISSSQNVIGNQQRGYARLGDEVRADCGHTSKIVTASSKVLVNGKAQLVARLGDQVNGDNYEAKIVSVSSKIFIGG
jgi:uncharacterized Zn-binding protein involved in type VI secretion